MTDIFDDKGVDGADTIDVIATIRLLTVAEGGRTSSLLSGSTYRPNHNFFGSENRAMAIGEVRLLGVSEASPGDTVEASVSFWNWDRLEGQIYPGRQWLVQEGARVVAVGVVREVRQ